MVYMMAKRDGIGEYESGVSLNYEHDPIALNHIFYSHCGDYHARVTGFWTGIDAWGKEHKMASVEQFLCTETAQYLAKHGLSL